MVSSQNLLILLPDPPVHDFLQRNQLGKLFTAITANLMESQLEEKMATYGLKTISLGTKLELASVNPHPVRTSQEGLNTEMDSIKMASETLIKEMFS